LKLSHSKARMIIDARNPKFDLYKLYLEQYPVQKTIFLLLRLFQLLTVIILVGKLILEVKSQYGKNGP
jgi:hypothetical protein